MKASSVFVVAFTIAMQNAAALPLRNAELSPGSGLERVNTPQSANTVHVNLPAAVTRDGAAILSTDLPQVPRAREDSRVISDPERVNTPQSANTVHVNLPAAVMSTCKQPRPSPQQSLEMELLF
eukprot:Clim_evm9s233 gene=Clim_evmTU9s233